MNILKKLDVIIIIFLLILSFTPYFIFSKTLSKNYISTYATIKVSNVLYDNIELFSLKEKKTLTIQTPNGNNTLLIKNNSLQILDADCNDSICVNQGVISNIGQTIVCLPHKLIIEIKGDEGNSSNDTILSY
ncbi:MAG: NusG domain II-containing protein [Romboutsia sp.]